MEQQNREPGQHGQPGQGHGQGYGYGRTPGAQAGWPPAQPYPYYPPASPMPSAAGPWRPPNQVARPARPAQPPTPGAKSGAKPARMPKEQALELTRRLKSFIIAGSVMSFGALTALAAGHLTGVTSAASSSSGSSASPATNSNNSNSDDNNNFFGQQPSNSSNNSTSSGGYGVSPNAPYQSPAAGSSVS